MSEYFPKPKSFGGRVKVVLDFDKNHKFLNKSIYFWLAFESYSFHGYA